MSPEINIIAAIAENRVIGRDNKLPWYLPEDLKRFKELTLNHPVIMGRKTAQSIIERLKKPLPERTNIVLTSTSYFYPGMFAAKSLELAIVFAGTLEEEKIFIIGGERVYREALIYADKLCLTLIDKEFEGDAFFPDYSHKFDRKVFEEEKEQDGLKYRFVELMR